jgi:hypothetical protein
MNRERILVLFTSSFQREELMDGDYLTSTYLNQLHESILEKEEFSKKIPDHYLKTFQVKVFHRNTKRRIVWTRAVSIET